MEDIKIRVNMLDLVYVDDFVLEMLHAGYPQKLVGGGELEITATLANIEYLGSILQKYDATYRQL